MSKAEVKNSFSAIGELDASLPPSGLELKLAAGTQALRYFVLSRTHRQVIFFGSYTLHHISTNAELCERLKRITEKDDVLQLPFGSVLAGLDTAYHLFPPEMSFLKRPEQMLQHCPTAGVDLVFDRPEELMNACSLLFPKVTFAHLSSSMLEGIPRNNETAKEKLYVNVAADYLDVAGYDNSGVLRLMNRYRYKAGTDFIYFLLLACDELRIDREKAELVLLGEVDIQSKIYDLCYRYFRHVSFVQKPENLSFSKAFDRYAKHLHFNLYNLNE